MSLLTSNGECPEELAHSRGPCVCSTLYLPTAVCLPYSDSLPSKPSSGDSHVHGLCVLCCIATDALGATLHNYLNVGSLINSVLRIKLKTPQ